MCAEGCCGMHVKVQAVGDMPLPPQHTQHATSHIPPPVVSISPPPTVVSISLPPCTTMMTCLTPLAPLHLPHPTSAPLALIRAL